MASAAQLPGFQVLMKRNSISIVMNTHQANSTWSIAVVCESLVESFFVMYVQHLQPEDNSW